MNVDAVLGEVAVERLKQDARWGEQNHPDGTSAAEYEELANRAKKSADLAQHNGRLTFADILLEESLEACAEEDPARLRAELIQVAAVAVCWIEAVDRRLRQASVSGDKSKS